MPPRNTILAIFSTFADLENDRIKRWIPDPRLTRNMTRSISQTGDHNAPEQVWVHYWVKQWRSIETTQQIIQKQPAHQHLPQQHLNAYLQESFYWTAQKITQRFPTISQSIGDIFQAASFEMPRLLKGYNLDRGSTLKSYATMVLLSIIKDQLRQQREVDICSQWSLLRKVSKRRLRETIEHFGMTGDVAEGYFLAWSCFNQCYVPNQFQGTERMNAPDRDCWQQITDQYNQQQPATPPITPQQIETRLIKLTAWIRAYFYPNVTSLNQTKAGYESGEIQDDLVGDDGGTLLDLAIDQEIEDERQAQMNEFTQLLKNAIAKLDADAQKLLQLFYQEQLSQQKIADRMSINQSQISRRMKKIEAHLLEVMFDWIQRQTHELPKPTELKLISDRLKAWLISYYQVETPVEG